MRFDFSDETKEIYFSRAEKQLKGAGIDFLYVKRDSIGCRDYKEAAGTAKTVFVDLSGYPYEHFSNKKKGMLQRLGNWQQTNDRGGHGKEKNIYMHSRLVFEDGGENDSEDI